MSGLPYQEIKARCEKHKLISPYHEKTVKSGKSFGNSESGYDIRVKQELTLYPVTLENLIVNFVAKLWCKLLRKKYKEPRPSFCLASSVEHFNLPKDLRAEVKDKSSWIREGLSVHNTVCEPGWAGYLTLELKVVGADIVHIREGDPIAQILFTKLTKPTDKEYSGKYQHQEDKPVESIRETTLPVLDG